MAESSDLDNENSSETKLSYTKEEFRQEQSLILYLS